MIPCREWFSNYKTFTNGTVYMGNVQSYMVVGMGIVTLKLSDGTIRILDEVRHVPHLKRNLIYLA